MIVHFLIKLHTCGICKATEEAPDTRTAAKKQRQVIHQAKGSEHGKGRRHENFHMGSMLVSF